MRHHPVRLQRRDVLPNSSIIIIAIVAAVAVVTLLLLIFCCRRKKSTPFPVIQPLAHHREQRVEAFLSLPPSNLSLPSRKLSFATEADVSLTAMPLYPEAPPFIHAQSSSSLAHSASELEIPNTPSASSHSSAGAFINNNTKRTSRRMARPKSMASVTSTSLSKRSSRLYMGVPHGPHSRVQIVLPAPLASELYSVNPLPLATSRPVSIADSWTPVAAIDSHQHNPTYATDPPPVPPVDSRFISNGIQASFSTDDRPRRQRAVSLSAATSSVDTLPLRRSSSRDARSSRHRLQKSQPKIP